MAVCGAKKKNGDICRAPALKGGVRCARHGGKTPAAREAALERVKQEQAESAVKTLGLVGKYPDVHEFDTLRLELRRSSAVVTWLEAEVGNLNKQELVWNVTEDIDGMDGHGAIEKKTRALTPHPLWEMLLKEREHLVKVSAAALKIGIDERRIQLQERDAAALLGVISRAINQAQLTREQRDTISTTIANGLRALEGNTA